VNDSRPLERELNRSPQNFEPITHAAAEINGRCFLEIFRWARNFADSKAKINALGQHLIIENEIVAVFPKGQTTKHIAAEGPVAGVIFR
jgi:hypothetical protein